MLPFHPTRAKLNALYDHVSGDITCRRPDGAGPEKLNGVHEAALDAGEPFAVSPVTSEGELAFYALTGPADVVGPVDERLPATFVSKSGDDVTLVYALRGATANDPRFPEPDWVWTDEEVIAGDLENPPVYDADLVARSIWTGPLNDATLYGIIPDEQMDMKMRLSFGKSAHDKRWPATDLTFANFLSLMTRHEEGEKDGKSFTQGEAIDGQRTKNAMKNLCILGGDMDTGVPLEEVHEIILRSGLTAIIYTTHSHLTARTAISHEALVKWMKKTGRGEDEPTLEDAKAFLLAVRDLDPRVAETISGWEIDQTAKGIQVLVEHAPMSKCRIVFPLARPFNFKDEAKLQSDAIKKWAGKIRGLFASLGLPIDESCTDPSRIFYLPRHKKGRPFDIRVYGGRLLDLDEIEVVERGGSSAGNVFLAAGEKDAGKDLDGTRKFPASHYIAPDGVDVMRFVKERADGFDLMEFFEAKCPERIRVRQGDKMTVECPFDGNHSNPGDAEDPGCFIASASPHEDRKFVFKCRHNSCADIASHAMLAEAVKQGWFEGKDLYDEDFDLLPRDDVDDAPAPEIDGEPVVAEEDRNEAYTLVLKELDKSGEWTNLRVQKTLYALAKTGPSPIQVEHVVKMLAGLTKVSKTALTKEYAAQLKKAPAQPKDKRKRDTGRMVRFDVDDGYAANTARLYALLMEEQAVEPFFFRKDDAPVIKRPSTSEGFVFLPLTATELRAHVSARTIWFDAKDDADVAPDKDVIIQVLSMISNSAPILDNIVTSPFFDIDGTLYQGEGYHQAVRTYINADTSDIPTIPEEPTYEEMIAARDFLLDPFCDFPFRDIDDPQAHASRAHLLCMILQPLMRRVFEDTPTPLYAINKPQPGSGSSLIVQLAAIISSGMEASSRGLPRNEDEIRKTISGILAQREPMAWFDNVSQFVNSDVLNATLTSTSHSDRPMGTLTSARFKNHAQWVITGNNLRFSKDMARRMLLIRLELDEAIDDYREFKYPNVKEYVTDNRPALVAAALTLIRYWFQNRPANWERLKWPTLATFEVFSRVCASMLHSFELPGFLDNAAAGSEDADDETTAWIGFLQAVYDTVGMGVSLEIGRSGGAFNAAQKTLLQIHDENHCDFDIGTNESQYGKNMARQLKKRANAVTPIQDRDGNRINVKIRKSNTRGGNVRWLIVDAKDDGGGDDQP